MLFSNERQVASYKSPCFSQPSGSQLSYCNLNSGLSSYRVMHHLVCNLARAGYSPTHVVRLAARPWRGTAATPTLQLLTSAPRRNHNIPLAPHIQNRGWHGRLFPARRAQGHCGGLPAGFAGLTSIEPMTPSNLLASRRILPLFASCGIASAQHEVVRLLHVAQLRAGGEALARVIHLGMADH
jgi:hypothetical protein